MERRTDLAHALLSGILWAWSVGLVLSFPATGAWGERVFWRIARVFLLAPQARGFEAQGRPRLETMHLERHQTSQAFEGQRLVHNPKKGL